ncbi:MAG TPA: hypothetical protein VHT97_00730 [Acidimicrobiales bacterium]|jgi:hypothetical protein|nr:hypothetical protein [Acidimicrobiales bacterium]
MPRSRAITTGYVILGLLGLSDLLSFVLGGGSDNGPPVAINVIGTILGVITAVALFLIFQGRRRGSAPTRPVVLTLVVTRVLSALLGVPAFFADIPGGIKVVVAVSIVLTVVGLTLIRPEIPAATAGGAAGLPAN